MDPDPETLAAEAAGDSVTPERLAPPVLEALADGEQPHAVLRGQSLDRADPAADDPDRLFPTVDAAVSVVATDRRVLFVVPKAVTNETFAVPHDEVGTVAAETGQFKEFRVDAGETEVTVNLAAEEDPEAMATFVEQWAGADDPGATPAASARDAASGSDRSAGAEESDTGTTADAADDTDPLDRIERLAELRDQEIITDAEFEERKADLLDRL